MRVGVLELWLACLLPGTTADGGGTGSGATISNVEPRRDVSGHVINAHAGGIYNFSNRFYLIGEPCEDLATLPPYDSSFPVRGIPPPALPTDSLHSLLAWRACPCRA